MAKVFSGRDIVEIALEIERQGAAFYEALFQEAQDERARGVFQYLSEDERRHEALFTSLRDKTTWQPLPESYPGEYEAYAQALAREKVWPHLPKARRLVGKGTGYREVLDLAVGFEKDALLFLHEIRRLVGTKDQPVIEALIQEEKKHLRDLSDLKKALVGTGEEG